MRYLSASAIMIAASVVSTNVHAKLFDNDTFRIAQEASDTFGFFVNGDRVSTLMGSGDLSASFSQMELANLLLANNGLSGISLASSSFFEALARDLKGLIDITVDGSGVNFSIKRSLIEENKSGTVSLKYQRPGGSDRNFVRIIGEALTDDGGDDDPVVVIVGGGGGDQGPNSQGGAGPFFNDEFTITKSGDSFLLEINGVELTPIADTGGDLSFSIPENTFKALILANNGVSGKFLGDDTHFFDFLAKGNAGLIDVTLGDNIGFKIDRNFVLHELSGESSFKYDAGGKKVRNFVNFVGVVNNASPSM